MKSLLIVVVTLVISRIDLTYGAPQPLALLNATDISLELDGGTWDEESNVNISKEFYLSTLSARSSAGTEINDYIPNKDLENSDDTSTNSNASVYPVTENEELSETATIFAGKDQSTSVGSTVFESTEAEVTTDRFQNINNEEDGLGEGSDSEEKAFPEEMFIMRYVPPLDPMKNMLMMEEVKKQLALSSTTVNLESTTSTVKTIEEESTLTPFTDTDIETSSASNISNSSGSEPLELSTETSTIYSTTLDLYADEINNNDTTLSSNESDSLLTNENIGPTNMPTTLEEEEFNISLASEESSDDNHKNSYIIHENSDISHESSDINHESSVFIRSSGLFSGEESPFKTEIDSENVDVTTLFSSANNTLNTESPILTELIELYSTDLPLNISSNDSSNDSSNKTESEGPSSIRSNEDVSLFEMRDNFSSEEETVNENDTDTASSTIAKATVTPSSESKLKPTSELITAAYEENFEKLHSLQNENKNNVSLSEEFEYKEEDLSSNSSDVLYVENPDAELETFDSSGDSNYSSSESINSNLNTDFTTESIFTTIREMLFPTTMNQTEEITVVPEIVPSDDLLHKVGDEVIAFSSSENSAETQSESILNISSEVVKEELPNANIDNLYTTTLSSEMDRETASSADDRNEFSSAESKVESSSTEELNEGIISEEEKATTAIDFVSTENVSLSSEFIKPSDVGPIPILSNSKMENSTEIAEKISDLKTKIENRYISGNNTDTVAAVQFLHYHDKTSSDQCFKLVDAHWHYATNLTDENKKKQLEQTLEYSLFHKEAWKNATSFAWKSFNDTHLRRWFKSLSVLGTAALPEEKLNEFNRLKAEMKNIYSTAKVCPYFPLESRLDREVENTKLCRLSLEPDLHRTLTKSRDYDELTHVWKSWRDAAGKPIRGMYLRFIELNNEAARLNGFSDTGDLWKEAYESETFEEDLEMLWEQLRPLYENLHAYVRRKLIQQYGNDKIKDDGPIPAHLFGNMWAQSWVSLLDITQPFPGKPSVDVTPIMEAKNLSALEMFQISEEFFTSLGLKEMPEEFWKHSLIEKPKDREIICHASAWDFCNGKDYRIKQCTDITMEDLITVHHEMGHIQYFLQYSRQPNVFREGANPGFHEAIGDVLALSVSTPKHLQSIGLLEDVADDPEGDLNFLLRTALDKVSFLPSGYLIDLWRWGLFSGEIKPEEMNTKWWDLRLKYQGICPPVKRYDTDFDAGAKYHVPGHVPYIRYFVSFVIQFQFHKVLCEAAGHTGPLYKCDIYRSREAGQILSQVMELGSSEHWSEAMKIMTGGATNKMDAGPILEYFQPLLSFLEEQNRNETLGWNSSDSTICP